MGNELSVRRQCELLDVNRSSLYYQPQSTDDLTLQLMRLVDEEYTRHPFYGTRKMLAHLRALGHNVNRKRVQRLYVQMGLEAVYPKPNLSRRNQEHKIFPYLLRGLSIERNNQVWSADITYIRMKQGFVYLIAIIDWFSRYVLDWQISPTLEADFCIETLSRSLEGSSCEIFNTDQGCQFTSKGFVDLLLSKGILVSMDGKGRALDNIFIERLWRSLKYECIFLSEFETIKDLIRAIRVYFEFYNYKRPHQSLGYQTPGGIYHA
jgi:putative transposase